MFTVMPMWILLFSIIPLVFRNSMHVCFLSNLQSASFDVTKKEDRCKYYSTINCHSSCFYTSVVFHLPHAWQLKLEEQASPHNAISKGEVILVILGEALFHIELLNWGVTWVTHGTLCRLYSCCSSTDNRPQCILVVVPLPLWLKHLWIVE